jgi:MFS family permease
MIEFCSVTNQDSLTAKLDLYCDGRKDDRNLIQSITGMGNMLGVLMVNWLADRKGKRFCVFLALFLASVYSYCLFIGILSNSIELILFSQFLIGYAYGAYTTLIFFLGSRYLS